VRYVVAVAMLLLAGAPHAWAPSYEELKDVPWNPSAPRPPSAPGDWHCERAPADPQFKMPPLPPGAVLNAPVLPSVAQDKWDCFQKLMPCPDEACRRAGFPACMLAKGWDCK
jgi:hypothetical protein